MRRALDVHVATSTRRGHLLSGAPTSLSLRGSVGGRHLLIVEDDAALRENLVEVFVMLGFYVSSAEDGTSALALLERDTPDLVLLDYALPDLSGGELFDRMKSAAHVPATILITGDRRAAELAAQHGMSCAVRKPFDTAALITLVTSVVSQSPMPR